eukprot:m.108350 g.108350  ORF g.108350 m.108350 type:complete len:202 (+) comp22626_c0_seq3:362-967(+)
MVIGMDLSENDLVVCGTNGDENTTRLFLLDLNNLDCMIEIIGPHRDCITACLFTKTGAKDILLTGADDGELLCWDSAELFAKTLPSREPIAAHNIPCQKKEKLGNRILFLRNLWRSGGLLIGMPWNLLCRRTGCFDQHVAVNLITAHPFRSGYCFLHQGLLMTCFGVSSTLGLMDCTLYHRTPSGFQGLSKDIASFLIWLP